MSNEAKAGTQTVDSSLDRIDLRSSQEPEMDSEETVPSAIEFTLRSVGE